MSPDFAIVGGGVIGCAIARELARAGAGRIIVIERGQPGGEASNAAAGLLAVASSRAPGGAVFELRRASASLFPTLVDELRGESGIDVQYSSAGLLDLASTDQQAEDLAKLVERRRGQGFSVELLDAAAVRGCEPAVNPAVRGGAWFPDDRSINSALMVEALHVAAKALGVEFRPGAPVTAVERAGERVMSITAGGERHAPGHLIIAAGAWSPEIGALLGVKIPVRPDRGEMLALRPELRLRNALSCAEAYVVPRGDGELLIGSTSARGETEKIVTAGSVALLLERALQMVPTLAAARLVRTWAGLRPMSTLRRPIIGPLRNYDNVTVATGHHRSGILLAPITAKLVAELLLQGSPSLSLTPFAYRPR